MAQLYRYMASLPSNGFLSTTDSPVLEPVCKCEWGLSASCEHLWDVAGPVVRTACGSAGPVVGAQMSLRSWEASVAWFQLPVLPLAGAGCSSCPADDAHLLTGSRVLLSSPHGLMDVSPEVAGGDLCVP